MTRNSLIYFSDSFLALSIQATNCDRFLCETIFAKFFRRQARLCDTKFYDKHDCAKYIRRQTFRRQARLCDTYFYDSLFLRQARLCDTHFYDKHVCATLIFTTSSFLRQARLCDTHFYDKCFNDKHVCATRFLCDKFTVNGELRRERRSSF